MVTKKGLFHKLKHAGTLHGIKNSSLWMQEYLRKFISVLHQSSSSNFVVCIFFFTLLVPSAVPHPVTASSYESPHKITFYWKPLPPSEINGQLLGYKVKYEMVSIGGEPVTDSEPLTAMVPPNEVVFILSNLSVYSSFQFKVAAVTTGGEGNFSEGTVGGIFWQCYIH